MGVDWQSWAADATGVTSLPPRIWLIVGVLTAVLLIGSSAALLGTRIVGNDWARDHERRDGFVVLAPDRPAVRPERSADASRRALQKATGGTPAPRSADPRPERDGAAPVRVREDAVEPPAPAVVRTLPGDLDDDGLSDALEERIGTDPEHEDTDGDALPDAWEEQHGLDPTSSGDAETDVDGDGLLNRTEFRVRSNPRAFDTDHDGTPDAADDADGDALPNGVEQALAGADPANPDTNGDGLPDGGDDGDGDGIANADEVVAGTDPSLPDAPAPEPVEPAPVEPPAPEPVEPPAPEPVEPAPVEPALDAVASADPDAPVVP
jgi:Bacterial TSP3 repeat